MRDALGVQLNDVDVGVLALANLGASLALHSVVAGCTHEGEGVQFAVLEACTDCFGVHLTPDDAVQDRLLAPPLVVLDQGENLLGGVPLADLEGTCPVLVEGLVNEAFVEEVDVFQCGVDCEGAQTLGGVIRSLHGDLDVEVVAVHSLDALNLLPHGVVGDVVGVVGGCAVDLPHGANSVHVHGGAVVEGSLGVDLEGRGLHAIDGLGLVLGAELGVEGAFAFGAHGVEAHHGGNVAGCQCVQVAGGVAALGLQVEVRAQGGSREGQGAALLEGGTVLLVDLKVLQNIFSVVSGATANLFLRAAAGSQ